MNPIRSVIFNIFYIFGSLFFSIFLLWTLVFPPRKCAEMVSKIYGGYMLWISRHIMGIKLEMRGLEKLPKDSLYIIAAKHQSAFETLVLTFMKRLNYPVIVLKKELTWLPLWGLYPGRMGLVPIDRGSGLKAMQSITRGAEKAVKDGRCLVIFPQGTRVTPGADAEYKTGLAKTYKDLHLPIVPMALNSGLFWGRNKFFKKSGTVVFEFLPPIPANQPPLAVMKKLEEVIEAASNALAKEAREKFF